jgi:S-adenosylmethionine:diacylglycerol 3-amino-3-carboxypropyl transferase
MKVKADTAATAWERGRLDARRGPNELLFGRMHEDASIELAAFRPGARVFCVASAGCTAMALSPRHEVVAADINPVQVAYARRRFSGWRGCRGAAERMMAFGRACAPLVGWSPARLREFLDLDDPVEQIAFWRRQLDTRRLRAAMDALLSRAVLRWAYAKPFLRACPRHFGRVMHGRMERGFARHSNRDNPYARALLLGELADPPVPPEAQRIRLVHADAATFLEQEPEQRFDGFSLSNILDGASDGYRQRLLAAVHRAAAPGAVAVIRSVAEPPSASATNRAPEDRTMLWGVVDVVPVDAL